MSYPSSRDKFIAVLSALANPTTPGVVADPEMVALWNKFMAKEIRLADVSLYGTKDIGTKTTIKMFETSDVKDAGLTNVQNGRLEKDQYVLVTSIIVVAVTNGAALTPTLLKGGLAFGTLIGQLAIASGQATLKIKDKQVIKDLSMYRFLVDNKDTVQAGEYILENPQLIRAQDLIEFNIELGVAPAANTAMRVLLNGTGTLPS